MAAWHRRGPGCHTHTRTRLRGTAATVKLPAARWQEPALAGAVGARRVPRARASRLAQAAFSSKATVVCHPTQPRDFSWRKLARSKEAEWSKSSTASAVGRIRPASWCARRSCSDMRAYLGGMSACLKGMGLL